MIEARDGDERPDERTAQPHDEHGDATEAGAAGATAEGLRALAGYERLLAELFARQPDEETLALAAAVPELGAHASPDAAAQHTHVFVLNAYPFATVFLDPEGGLDGSRAAFTRDVLRALGFGVAEGVAADHVSVTLEALASLLEREADAERAVDAERARHAQATLLVEHLLPWAPTFLAAVERVDEELYGACARLARSTLLEHAARIVPARGAAPGADALPQAAQGEHAPPDGAGDSAPLAWLATPARCGLFLSRADITRLGAAADLPVRFGGRRFMLESLARGAREQERSEALRDALAAFARDQRTDLAGWRDELPTLGDAWAPTLARVDATLDRLEGRAGP